MNRFEREHLDGIGDGLSIAIGILTRAADLTQATDAIRSALLTAREAKDRANLAELRELASVPA